MDVVSLWGHYVLSDTWIVTFQVIYTASLIRCVPEFYVHCCLLSLVTFGPTLSLTQTVTFRPSASLCLGMTMDPHVGPRGSDEIYMSPALAASGDQDAATGGVLAPEKDPANGWGWLLSLKYTYMLSDMPEKDQNLVGRIFHQSHALPRTSRGRWRRPSRCSRSYRTLCCSIVPPTHNVAVGQNVGKRGSSICPG